MIGMYGDGLRLFWVGTSGYFLVPELVSAMVFTSSASCSLGDSSLPSLMACR
jgi:hypothetical protein